MHKSTKLSIIAFLLAAVLPLAETFAQTDKPNIVLIVADDLGWTDLGCTGSKVHSTPAIDSLARDGISFSNAYASSANCAPSRASLITGQYVPRHGMTTVKPAARGKAKNRKLIVPEPVRDIPKEPQSLGELIKSAGYATCVAGKWHVSDDPAEYGFDQNFGGNHSGHPRSYFSPYKNSNLADGPKGEHLPDRLANDVSNWITEHKEQPFFVYLPFYSVHTPIQARRDLTEKYQKKHPELTLKEAKYASMTEAMDLAVAKILKTLDENALSQNTIVIFTSDNGPYGPVSDAKPLRGSKGMFYEGGIRVPFLVRWPGHVEAGTTSKAPLINIDLFPTLAAVSGAKLPKQPIDGMDISEILAGTDAVPKRELFWHFPAYLGSYGGPNHACMQDARDPRWRTTPCSVIRSGDWKLIQYFEDDALELYNLADDIGEKNNVADEKTAKRDELLAKLTEWQQATKAQIPNEPNPAFKQ